MQQGPPPPAAFTVISGPCTLEMDGTCVGRPAGYSNSETCEIASTGSAFLQACPVFSTESGCKSQQSHHPTAACSHKRRRHDLDLNSCDERDRNLNQFRGADDHLNIDGTTYEGTNCPQGVQLTARSTIAWTSDGSVAGDGWEICAGAEDTLRSDPLFTVVSGPCTLEMDGTCVGRPSGYSDSERCQIASTGSVHLSNCPIFNTERGCEAANRLASPPACQCNELLLLACRIASS